MGKKNYTNSKKENDLSKWIVPIIVALIGAYATLVVANKIPTPFEQEAAKPTITVTVTSSEDAASQPIPITGTWIGAIASVNGGVRYQMEVYIKTFCEFGQTCGTYEASNLGCEGDIIYSGMDKKDFLFTGSKTAGSNSCASTSTIRFILENNDQLKITYSANDVQYSGVLARK